MDNCREGNKTGSHNGEGLAQATIYKKRSEGLSEEERGKPRSDWLEDADCGEGWGSVFLEQRKACVGGEMS